MTVEELDPDSPTGLADARERLEELNFPFRSAQADKALLDGLQRMERILFARVRELAVPTSYLFDAQGRLAAIYRGKVDIDTLLQDLELLPLQGAELMARALPFQGRSLNPFLPAEVFLPQMAAAQLNDDPEAAISLLQAAIAYQTERRATGLLNATQTSRLEAELASSHVQLGRAFAALGRAREAADSYQSALRIDPRQADAMGGLGALLSASGRYEQSVEMYRRAFNIRPADPAIRTNLGISEMYGGDINRAVELFTTLVSEAPDSADAQFNLGIALGQLGQSREAHNHLSRSVELNPSGVAALTELAWMLATERDGSLRDGTLAVTLAERARSLAVDPDATILDTLAAAYAESGRFEDAQATAAQAREQARIEQNPALIRFISQRIRSYQRRRPYRE